MDKFERAKELHENLEMYSTKYIRRYWGGLKKPIVCFCDRWYGTFERPDWTYHFEVTREEADAIVSAGYATYWDSPDETFSDLTFRPN